MLNIGFYYVLLTKKSELSKVIIVTVIAFVFPILMYFTLSSQFNMTENPSNISFPACPLNPCYEYIIASDSNVMREKFVQLYQENFQSKIQPYQVVDNVSILQDNILNLNQGHYKFGIYINNQRKQVQIYTNSKQSNLPIYDKQVVASPLLRIMSITNQIIGNNNTIVGPSINFEFVDMFTKNLYDSMRIAQLSMFSMTYLTLSINIIVSFAILKDNNVYDYLIVCGLDRLKFFGGIAGYIILEMTIASIILIIIYQVIQITDITVINILVPILSLIPSLHYTLCFSYFIFTLFKNIKAIIPVYILLGFIPTQIIMVIYANTNISSIQGFKVLKGFFQFIFPGISSSYILENAQYIVQEQTISVGNFLTFQSSKTYSNIAINLISLFSGLFYILLGVIVDNCATYHSHPTYSLKTLLSKIKYKKHTYNYQQYNNSTFECQIDAINLCKDFIIRKKAQNNGIVRLSCYQKQKINALKNITIQLRQDNQHTGKIIGVVGSNASGKSTFFKLIAQLHKPTSGQLNVCFSDQKLQSLIPTNNVQQSNMCQMIGKEYFKKLAIVFQENIQIKAFQVIDMLQFIYRIMNDSSVLTKEQITSATKLYLQQMGLEKTWKQKVRTLSGGQIKRLNVAYSMCRQNPLLRILDEPACGVDIESRKWLWKYLRQCNNQITLITTHLIEEVEELCDEVVFLRNGNLVINGSLSYVKEALSDGYKIDFSGLKVDSDELKSFLDNIGVKEYTLYAGDFVQYIRLGLKEDDKISSILTQYQGIYVTCPNMTEIFTKIEGENDISQNDEL